MKNIAGFKLEIVLALLCTTTIIGCGGSQSKTGTTSQANTTTTTTTTTTLPNTASVVPQGAWKTQQTITNRYLPADFGTNGAIMATAQVATLSKTQSEVPATVEVDYMRLIEDDPITGTKILAESHYDIASPQGLTINQGALYDRSPVWYGYTDKHVPMLNSSIQNSVLKIDMSSTPDNIGHWWTDRTPSKQGATYYVEMRVKISGKVSLQAGADFWKDMTSSWAGDNVNNREYFSSDWYGDTNGQYIVIRVPHY